jgi:polynucleotide 5'-hydroxyl-kinase GRC3/NOL9
MAHYIGATSPRSSPSHYLAAIQATLEAYRLDVQVPSSTFSPSDEVADDVDDDRRIHDFIPLVINTMGWTKGLGADLNKKIEDMAQPTHVYEIEGDISISEGQPWPPPPVPDPTKNPYSYPGSDREMKSHLLTAIPPSVLSTNYTAADHRALSILSYFYAIFSSPSYLMPQIQADNSLLLALSDPGLTALQWDTSLPLLAQPPYEVDSRVFRSLVLSGAGSEDVIPTEVGMVLNAALVGLVACQFDSEMGSGNAPRETADDERTIPYIQGRAPPSPAISSCLGIALIRSTSAAGSSSGPSSLDLQTLQMHILTPLPPPYLAQAKVVVKGEMELPVWGWLDHRVDTASVAGLDQGKMPYLQWGKGPEGALGSERRRVRRNLMRRGQM